MYFISPNLQNPTNYIPDIHTCRLTSMSTQKFLEFDSPEQESS